VRPPTQKARVTYSVFSDNACTTKVVDAGTVTVLNGMVQNSKDVTFNNPGTFYWQAVYSATRITMRR